MSQDPIRTFDAADGNLDAPGEPRLRPAAEVPVDDDLPTGGSSPLDELRDELADLEDEAPTRVPILKRPGWVALFAPNLEANLLGRWRKASADRSMPDGVDELALAQRVLANLNVGLERNGEELLTEGQPMTVRSPAFLELIGEDRPMPAVRKLFANDGHVLAAATEVVRSAGYGDDLGAAAADPTPRR